MHHPIKVLVFGEALPPLTSWSCRDWKSRRQPNSSPPHITYHCLLALTITNLAFSFLLGTREFALFCLQRSAHRLFFFPLLINFPPQPNSTGYPSPFPSFHFFCKTLLLFLRQYALPFPSLMPSSTFFLPPPFLRTLSPFPFLYSGMPLEITSPPLRRCGLLFSPLTSACDET